MLSAKDAVPVSHRFLIRSRIDTGENCKQLYWQVIAGFLLSYGILTHFVRVWFIRRWGI